MKTLTIQDVIDAMEKNGLPMHQGDYFDINGEGEVVAACIWGQAGYNLKVEPSALHSAVSNAIPRSLTGNIVRMNDYGDPDLRSAMDHQYNPIKYEKVVEYAKEILSPFAQKEIEIIEDEEEYLAD